MSDLNLHFNIGQIDTPECSCHAKNESSLRYLIDCYSYTGECQTLFNLVAYYIPHFKTISKNMKYEVLVITGITKEILNLYIQKLYYLLQYRNLKDLKDFLIDSHSP